MRSCRNGLCTSLLALLVINSFSTSLLGALSGCGFANPAAARSSATARSIGSCARRAEGQISFGGADDASAVAAALEGKKINNKVVQARQEGTAVVLSGLDGDVFGKADVKAELVGTIKGAPVAFNARQSVSATPLAVAFIDSAKIEGVLLLGSGEGQPSLEEVSFAKKMLGAGTDMDGSVSNLGLPKRWLKPLLGAKFSSKKFNPFEEYIPFAIGVGVLLVLVLGFALGSVTPDSSTFDESERSVLGER